MAQSMTQGVPQNSQTVKYNPCDKRDKHQSKLKITQKKLVMYKKECDDEKYKEIVKYIKDDTVESLMEGLFNYYTEKKQKEPSFVLTFEDFVYMFPRDSTLKTVNYKRQHVFEALCKILLLLNYDCDKWGKDKTFYSSLEKYVNGKQEILTKEDILDQKVNEGSAAGSVDIFFKIGKSKKTAVCNLCETYEKPESKKEIFILIQNKFYTNEQSAADKYDIPKILLRAAPLSSDKFDNSEIKLVLMVNNKESLLSKIARINNDDFSLVPKENIYGCKEINEMFNELLYDIIHAKTINDILQIKKESRHDTIQLRFHQKFFINVTLRYLNEGYKKFIWGAVPRSGKSYIIGGLINERKHLNNNVILFLGAKNETECQFVEMFCKYTNFDEYRVILPNAKKYTGFKRMKDKKDKHIFIFSQEFIKVNDIKSEGKFWSKYRELFGDKNVDIYFDEIHKGGTTETSQNEIINAIMENGYTIDLFTMVTATYAKPTIAYRNIVDSKAPVIINWSYEDHQNMKKVTDESIKYQILNSRDDIQKEELTKLFTDYEDLYHDQYLKILEDDYSISPELVILRGVKNGSNVNILSDFKLKCSAIPLTKEEYTDPYSIFENTSQVENVINTIGRFEDKNGILILPQDTIYGNLLYKLNYTIDKPHTQLWFLPYQNLYTNPEDCQDRKTKKRDEITGEEEEIDKFGLPNIEPLIRGLLLVLLNNKYFEEKFCFLAVYGGNRTPEFIDSIKNDCITFSHEKKDNIKQIIHDCEINAYNKGKSLIILTGAMLRLGISIANADIAFNFDRNKSIDLNYQTMFRVLTERQGKKYGYYYDFYPDRCQQFIYDYNSTYTNFDVNDTEEKNKLLSLLYLFKYDGLGVFKSNTIEQLKLYDSLIEELKINDTTYNQYYTSNTSKIISSTLNSIRIDDTIMRQLLDDIKRYKLNLNETKPIRKTVKKGIKEGNTTVKYKDPDADADEDEVDEDEVDEDEGSEITQKDIEIYLSDYTNIISLFSKEYECSNILDCIENIKIMTSDELCNCNKRINVLGCYMNIIKGYDKKKFMKSLKIYKQFINSNERLKYVINNIFIKIRDKMGKTKKLIKNMESADIRKLIEDYLPVRKIEKDKFGEVFTPVVLINEILDQLPPSVWKDKNLKWLEPANGTGNFMMIVYKRLMDGLKSIQNTNERSKHILDNMLYMVEINSKNVAISRKIFGNKNVLCADFLETDILKTFKVDGFDIIIGNPPFNKERTQDDKRAGGHGNKKIWDKFIFNSLELLNTKGYLAFITPADWRAPPTNKKDIIYDLMTKDNYLKYLHIYSKKDGQQFFNVSQRFDIYIVQKNTEGNSYIIDELNNSHTLNIKEWPFLPNYEFTNIYKILTDESKGIDVLYDTIYHTQKTNMSSKKTNIFKYPVIHSINNEGIVFWYSNKNIGHFGVSKVILNFNEKQYNWPEQNDYEGKYGMGLLSFGIPIESKKQGTEILNAIDTDKFKQIIKATKWSAFQTDYRMFKYFKPNFYKYFKLSKYKSRVSVKVKELNN